MHEFSLIEDIKKIFEMPGESENLILGIGDDSAVIQNDKRILISKDLFIEDIHFKTEYLLPREIGYKSLVVNISDIAAMGGKPLFFLLGLGIPDDYPESGIYGILEGMKKASDEYSIRLIGGDISKSPGGFLISITIIGESAGEFLQRSKSSPGESIYVTGMLGESGAGLELLMKNNLGGDLQNSHKLPKARVRESMLLTADGIPSSMIDISDGMVADLYHILQDSDVGAEIYRELIPISSALQEEKNLQKSPVEYALYGGEDYELIFTTSKFGGNNFKLYDEEKKCYYEFYFIGKITDEKQKLYIIDEGVRNYIRPKGYRHF